jgi:P27 family predicted phage terminase small subunit
LTSFVRARMYLGHRNTERKTNMKPKLKRTSHRAPSHLRAPTRGWWRSVDENFELEDHHRHLLTAACEELDTAHEADEVVKKEGAYFTNRHGERKPHPALNVARDARALFCRILRELQLDDPASESAPPTLSGYRRK